jgi:hypothetical protein
MCEVLVRLTVPDDIGNNHQEEDPNDNTTGLFVRGHLRLNAVD